MKDGYSSAFSTPKNSTIRSNISLCYPFMCAPGHFITSLGFSSTLDSSFFGTGYLFSSTFDSSFFGSVSFFGSTLDSSFRGSIYFFYSVLVSSTTFDLTTSCFYSFPIDCAFFSSSFFAFSSSLNFCVKNFSISEYSRLMFSSTKDLNSLLFFLNFSYNFSQRWLEYFFSATS